MTWGEIRAELAALIPGRGNDLLSAWMRRSYREILDQRDWMGLHADRILQTVAPHNAGSISLTSGSTAVTGVGTAFTSAMTGRKIRATGGREWYTFTYVSPTSGTLDRPYEGTSGTNLGYTIYQDTYTVAPEVKLVETMGGQGPQTLEFLRRLDFLTGEPQLWAPGNDTDESNPPVLHTVELWPAPQSAFGIPYRYLTAVYEFDGMNTSDSPLPWVSPDAIIAGVLYRAGAQDRTDFDRFLSLMERVENQRTPSQHMRMSPVFRPQPRRMRSWR
jgi:hypothetical protein